MRYAEKLAKGSLIIFAFSITTAIIGYLLRVYLARNLTVAEFGLFYAVMALVSFFWLVKDLGVGTTLVKFIPEFLVKKKYSEIKSDDNKIGSFRNDIVRHDISALRSNYKFDKRTGIHKHLMTGEPFCTACLLQGIESPLTESDEGWQCNNRGCDKFYLNPNYNPPGTELESPRFS